MFISEFDYKLPENLIAQKPLENRESSWMLALDKEKQIWKDEHFFDFPRYLKSGDILVLNNTKVFPARLFGETETGAKVELFLVKENENSIWEVLAKPGKRLKTGKKIVFGENLTAEVLEKTPDGKFLVKFETDGNFDEIIDEIGKTPLPPYIKREEKFSETDRGRYQTVFAKQRGAIAAPTAGLHFTPEILNEITARGVIVTEITLHVGYGTFEPVRVEDLSEHKVATEHFEISEETAELLNKAKSEKRRIVAVGTTTTRALESAVSNDGEFSAGKATANLTITPGYKFRAINALLTNFHLPKSSLLVLVSTFGGHEFIMKAYAHAVGENYRFYSYGDCMFIF
jgi:S-adenosylmethionine:tRNA ribosyltransferase-isomerase